MKSSHWYKKVRRVTGFIHMASLVLAWVIARFGIKAKPERLHGSSVVFLISCDPDALIGSKGDEAMTCAAIEAIAGSDPRLTIMMASTNYKADLISQNLKTVPFRVWGSIFMPFLFFNRIKQYRPSAAFLIGADIMDGHYSVVTSMRMLIAADLMALSGSKVSILGCSINERPAKILKYLFRRMDSRVAINFRDPVSLARFREFTGIEGNLVADTAFLLEPKPLTEDAKVAAEWVRTQRLKSRTVIAFNFHPMLFGADPSCDRLARVVAVLVEVLKRHSVANSVSWLLLPHDDRSHAGDIQTLAALARGLYEAQCGDVYFLKNPPPAAQIKNLVGEVHGVITARMHLAIAALGQGVPVAVFNYQGKFAGLMQHFKLPAWLVLDSQKGDDLTYISTSIERFLKELPQLRRQVNNELDGVMARAKLNFGLLP